MRKKTQRIPSRVVENQKKVKNSQGRENAESVRKKAMERHLDKCKKGRQMRVKAKEKEEKEEIKIER